MALRAIGKWYRLHNNIRASVFDSGATILIRDDAAEFFDAEGNLNSTTDAYAWLWADIGQPFNVREYIQQHGRPFGTIWGE